MGLDYTLIAGLLLYVFVMRIFANGKIGIIAASATVVLGSFMLGSFVKGIILAANDAPLSQLFGLVPIVAVVAQLLVAMFIFRILQEKEESYGAWLLWGVVGCVGIFFIVPFVASAIFTQFS